MMAKLDSESGICYNAMLAFDFALVQSLSGCAVRPHSIVSSKPSVPISPNFYPVSQSLAATLLDLLDTQEEGRERAVPVKWNKNRLP